MRVKIGQASDKPVLELLGSGSFPAEDEQEKAEVSDAHSSASATALTDLRTPNQPAPARRRRDPFKPFISRGNTAITTSGESGLSSDELRDLPSIANVTHSPIYRSKLQRQRVVVKVSGWLYFRSGKHFLGTGAAVQMIQKQMITS